MLLDLGWEMGEAQEEVSAHVHHAFVAMVDGLLWCVCVCNLGLVNGAQQI